MNTFYEIKERIKGSFLGEKIYAVWYGIGRQWDNFVLKKYENAGYSEQIRSYKNNAVGKRCFIIGNGPSLRLSDLEQLEGEDTFAANRIYGAFEKIDWHPTYYWCQDSSVMRDIIDDIDKIEKKVPNIFLNYLGFLETKLPLIYRENVHYFYASWRQGKCGEITFSTDCERYIGASMTVVYAMIQFAVYMGYREIYLLGIDHNYSQANDGTIQDTSYAEFIAKKDLSQYNLPHLDMSTRAYVEARKYCDNHNIKIYNATRGGKLEVFERVDFEKILKI